MTEQQTRPLARIIAKAAPVSFVAVRTNPSENGERDTMRFRWEIIRGGNMISGKWSCGSAVPLFGLGIASTNTPQQREAIRREFRPTLADIVSALLRDYETAELAGNAWDMCREFGIEGIDAIQEAVESFPGMLRKGRFIVQWLDFLAQEAMEAVRDE